MSLYPAVVAATSPLTVRLQGAATAVPATRASWSSYAPAVNDLVLVDRRADNGTLIVLGKA